MRSRNHLLTQTCTIVCAGALLVAAPAVADGPPSFKVKAKNFTLTECPPVLSAVASAKPHRDCASTQLTEPLVTVATLKDSNRATGPADYVAAIEWGDGSVGLGDVRGDHGKFTVLGQHPYAAPGTYTTEIFVTDELNGTSAGVLGRIKVKFKSAH